MIPGTLQSTPVPRPFYTPGQLMLAGLLGSPMAAGWLMAANYRVAGKPKFAWRTLLGSFVGTVLWIGIALFLPRTVGGGGAVGINIGLIGGFREMARQLQGPMQKAYLAGGGRKGSWWWAAGVGLLWMVIIYTLLLGTLIIDWTFDPPDL